MKSRLGFNILIIIFVVGTVFALKSQILSIYEQLTGRERSGTYVASQMPMTYQAGVEAVVQPEPLRKMEQFPFTILSPLTPSKNITTSQVVELTNKEREKYGIPTLTENAKLDASAEAKVDDMIAKGYFEHVSPDGTTLVDLVNEEGYKYIIIGENLALGNFKSTSSLIASWMKSQGHRDNILNSKFTEIGASVKKGTFEGRNVWFAVQHFGLPSSACPEINAELKAHVQMIQASIKTLGAEIDMMKGEIDAGNASNADIEAYNAKVSEYNKLVTEEKEEVKVYNAQVEKFNSCVNA